MRGFPLRAAVIAWLVGNTLASPAHSAEVADFYGLTKLHKVEVIVSAEDYKAMDPPPPAMGRMAAPAAGRPAPGSPDFGAGNFGFEFPYVHAKVNVDGEAFSDIGLRYKGSGTYMMSIRQTKRSLKFDFDRFNAQQTYHGIKKLNLNSGVMDPSKAREVLAYDVFSTLGVPCSRTALAEVTLTVPGKFDHEYLGAFTVVEQVDKAFLKRHFQSDKGLLLKPEGIRGLPHFGDDPKVYEASYLPKTDGTPEQWQRLVEFTRLLNQTDEDRFRQQIGDYLDLDNFASFLAVNTALASLDGFIGMGHNYYLYLSPKSGKFAFIPWDLDLAFGAFPMFGSPSQLVQLSIQHPHVGENKLIDRLLAMPDFKTKYRVQLQRLQTEVLASNQLGEQAAALNKALAPLIDKEKTAAKARKEEAGLPGGGLFGAIPLSPTDFITQRQRSLAEQLAGNSQGYIPTPGMMGGGMGPPRVPPVGGLLARPLMAQFDSNQDGKVSDEEWSAGVQRLSRQWDRDQSGDLDEQELASGLQALIPMPLGPMGAPGR